MTDSRHHLPKNIRRWAFYGFANHSYQVVYIAFILPIFFSTAFASYHLPLSAWGLAAGSSTIFGVILAIVLGKYADRHNKRLVAYRWAVSLTCIGLVAMALVNTNSAIALYCLFILTNAIFIWSIALYDSILPHLSNNSTVYEYGGFAWGFGYVGGIASLVIALVLQYVTGTYSIWVFLSVPIFYGIFSVYSLSGLDSVSAAHSTDRLTVSSASIKISRKEKVTLFAGYWLISECVTVIGLFAATYLSGEMHLSTLQVGIAFLIIQVIGFPATWYGGVLTRRYNSLSLLGLTILGWGIVLVAFIFLHIGLVGIVLATVCMGLVYGNTQSYVRSQYATLVDKKESGYQFGLYSFVSEAAVIVGPLVYGFASDKLHSQKIPLLGLYVLMALGYGLVWSVMHRKSLHQ